MILNISVATHGHPPICVYVYIYDRKHIYYITDILELYFWMEVILFKEELCMQFFCLNNVLYLNSLFCMCDIFSS